MKKDEINKSLINDFGLIGFLVLAIFISGCQSKPKTIFPEDYINRAMDSVEHYSIHYDTFNFDSLRKEMLAGLAGINDTDSVHSAILEAIKTIDRHSYVMTREEYQALAKGQSPEVVDNPFPFKGNVLKDRYAYVSIKGFSGVDSTSSKNYADSLTHLIIELSQANPDGWIIDLRYNHGGWIYPMISGLGPLLDKGVLAYELDRNGNEEEFFYFKNDSNYSALADSVFFISKRPIAVLIGPETGSAGELLALCFRGNEKTALIGQLTFGVATGLWGFFMPDSTQIAVTNTIMTDRNKMGDGKSIQPNIAAENALDSLEKAYQWIDQNQ